MTAQQGGGFRDRFVGKADPSRLGSTQKHFGTSSTPIADARQLAGSSIRSEPLVQHVSEQPPGGAIHPRISKPLVSVVVTGPDAEQLRVAFTDAALWLSRPFGELSHLLCVGDPRDAGTEFWHSAAKVGLQKDRALRAWNALVKSTGSADRAVLAASFHATEEQDLGLADLPLLLLFHHGLPDPLRIPLPKVGGLDRAIAQTLRDCLITLLQESSVRGLVADGDVEKLRTLASNIDTELRKRFPRDLLPGMPHLSPTHGEILKWLAKQVARHTTGSIQVALHRSSLSRELSELKDLGLVDHDKGGYAATSQGKVVAARLLGIFQEKSKK